jgi:hypothetical protein
MDLELGTDYIKINALDAGLYTPAPEYGISSINYGDWIFCSQAIKKIIHENHCPRYTP